MSGGRPGFVLVAVVALILALGIGAVGMLTIGAREAVMAARVEEVARLGLRAESRVRETSAAWSTRDALTLPVGAVGPAPSRSVPIGAGVPGTDATIERLEHALFRVVAVAHSPAGRRPFLRRTAAGLIRVLDPRALEDAFAAAVQADSARIERGSISGTDACDSRPSGSSGSPGPAALPGVRSAGAVRIGAGATVEGAPPIQRGGAHSLPTPDPLSDPLLSTLADLRVGPGSAWPRPTDSAGSCRRGPSSWGAVSPGHACHDSRPLVHARGPLVLKRGEARGIVVVEGDLELDGRVVLEGAVLVTGRLTLSGGARVLGAVRAAHLVMRDGTIQLDRCAIRDAVSAPALDRAFRPATGFWTPSF